MEKFKNAIFKEKPTLDERWYVEYSYIHPETGKFKVFREFISNKIPTKEGRRRKGYEIARAFNIKLKQGWNPFQVQEKRFTSITQAMDYVYEIKKSTTEKRTHHTYNNMISTFKKYLEKKKLDKLSCDEFNYHHAIDYIDYLKLQKKFTNRTYNNHLSSMRTFFTFLQKRDFIVFNPFLKIDMLEESEPELLTYTNIEMQLIKTRLPEIDPQLFTCTQLVYYAALRPAEIVRLRIYYIDFQKRLIRIPGTSTKNKKMQPIKMPEQLFNYLLGLNLDRYPENYYLLSKNFLPGETKIAPTRIAERWRHFANEIGFDKRKTIYLLKHTAAGKAIESGINAREMQLHLRHHSLDMTQRYLEKFNNIGGEKIQMHFPNF
ncbi:MAG: tyrosine-type recombinase/integrase [Salinivirgaceae bacterium]